MLDYCCLRVGFALLIVGCSVVVFGVGVCLLRLKVCFRWGCFKVLMMWFVVLFTLME